MLPALPNSCSAAADDAARKRCQFVVWQTTATSTQFYCHQPADNWLNFAKFNHEMVSHTSAVARRKDSAVGADGVNGSSSFFLSLNKRIDSMSSLSDIQIIWLKVVASATMSAKFDVLSKVFHRFRLLSMRTIQVSAIVQVVITTAAIHCGYFRV
jgi:hypothetical protein